jgi:hypothetical protein
VFEDIESVPRARRPVVNVLGFAAQTLLEKLTVLAEVMQQTGQSRLVGRAERRRILCGPFGDGL